MFSFKIVRRLPPPKVQLEAIKAEVVKAVTTVAKQHVAERRRITDKFSFPVDWEFRVNIRETGLQLLILLKNARQAVRGRLTVASLLEFLFVTGVRTHVIRARPGNFLRFEGPGTYERITPTSGTRPGSGMTGSTEVFFRREVVVKGFEPSPAINNIDRRLTGTLKKAYDRGIRVGLQRAKKR